MGEHAEDPTTQTTQTTNGAESRYLTGRRLPRGATRQRLLDAAQQHFANQAYDEVTVAEIAQTAGVAHGLLFHYFQNKRGIFLACMHDVARQISVAHETDPAQPPGARIRQLLRSHLDHMAGHEHLALRLILTSPGSDPDANEIFERDRRAMTGWACRQLGLDPDEPALQIASRTFASAADEATLQWLSTQPRIPLEAMTDGLVELLAGTLLAASAWGPGLDVAASVAELRRHLRLAINPTRSHPSE
jgi:AcrR family transcriptional regulator